MFRETIPNFARYSDELKKGERKIVTYGNLEANL